MQIIEYDECRLHLRCGYEIQDGFIKKENIRQEKHLFSVICVLVLALKNLGISMPTELLRYICQLAQTRHSVHFLLSNVQGRIVDRQYLFRLAHSLRIDEFIKGPSRSWFGEFSPRCYYKNEEMYRDQYISWYNIQLKAYKSTINYFLKEMSFMGWSFSTFPARMSTQRLVWNNEIKKQYGFTPNTPCNKPGWPSGPGPRLASSQIWWKPTSGSRYWKVLDRKTKNSPQNPRILKNGRVKN